MAYIITSTGRKFYPLEPTADMVNIIDIASHLSKACRWTGALKGDLVYSVAQHSVAVSVMTEFTTRNLMAAYDGLHHDDSEAYLVDVARPIKYLEPFKSTYMHYEERITSVIYQKFGIPWNGQHHPEVKIADNRMLMTEARDLIANQDIDLGSELPPYECIHLDEDNIWSPFQARTNYLDRHYRLLCRIKLQQQTEEGELID
jgi:uncharacterized protein